MQLTIGDAEGMPSPPLRLQTAGARVAGLDYFPAGGLRLFTAQFRSYLEAAIKSFAWGTMPDHGRLSMIKGGRRELGRQLIRAMIEFRSDDVRAIAERIVHRGSLKVVETDDADGPPRTAGFDAEHLP